MPPLILYRDSCVTSAAEVPAAYDRHVDSCRYPAEAILFEIPRDVSSDIYQEIIQQIAVESRSRNRVVDKVKYPRTAPYNPPKQVVVRNVANVDVAYSQYATNFYCFVPSNVPEETRQEIIFRASEYDVAVEYTLPGDSSDDDDDQPNLPGWGNWTSGDTSD